MKSRVFFSAIASILCVGVLAAPTNKPSLAKTGGTIRIALNADIRSTEIGVNRDTNTDTLMMHVVEGLVAYGEQGVPKPLLAESFQVSADGKTYTFKLRNDVKFHNDATMTAADVLWSWKRWLNPETKWLCLKEFDGSNGLKIESVEAPNPQTVVFALNRPSALFLTHMAAMNCGSSAILHKDSLNPDGSWNTSIGTGPYKFGTWKRGEYVELDAFRDYTRTTGAVDGYAGAKTPYADKLRWVLYKDTASARDALIKGNVDILPGLSLLQYAEMGGQPGIAVKFSPTMSVYGILIQTKDPLFSNVSMRHALAYTLDIKTIAKAATGGIGAPTPSIVPAISPYHTLTHNQGYDVNIEKAKKLLKESGYVGQPIKLQTNKHYSSMYEQAVLVQTMAKRAGINIELDVMEWKQQLENYQKGTYQLSSFGYSPRVDPVLSYEAILGDRTKNPNKIWDNPQAIAWNDEAAKISGKVQRQALFDKIHKKMLEDVPMIVICNPGDTNAMTKHIQDFASWPLTRERLFGVWRLD